MKIIYFNGHDYKWANMDGCGIEATLERNIKIMSPLILVNEIAEADGLLPDAEITEDLIAYTL